MTASKARSAGASIQGLTAISSSVGTALQQLSTVTKRAVQQMLGVLKNAEQKAKVSGTNIGKKNVNQGAKTELSRLPATASTAINAMRSTLNAAQPRAYSCGVYIGSGLANGLRSQIGCCTGRRIRTGRSSRCSHPGKGKDCQSGQNNHRGWGIYRFRTGKGNAESDSKGAKNGGKAYRYPGN